MTRSQLENWDITHLEAAATRWRASAAKFEELFSRHRQNISGTEWEGTAKDAALDRVTADTAVVDRHGEVVRAAADLADSSVADLRAAAQKALTAIAEAEADGFRVSEDLRVTDTRRWDINSAIDRNRALAEHTENIRWNAEQLVAADTSIGERLTAKASELDGITFDGADNGTIKAASFGDGFKQDGPLGDLPGAPGDPFPYPWEPPPPPDSRPGGGRWDIDYDHPYQGSGTPSGQPEAKAWSKEFPTPITGHPSGLKEIASGAPPEGWGVKPGWIGSEGYRFRVVGEEYNGSPAHTRWIARDGTWYPATWVDYQYEAEHIIQFAPQNDMAGVPPIRLGLGEWNPTDITEIYQARADNPSLTMYIPNPFGGMHQLSPSDPGAWGR
ncbi:hypothetical protein MHN83_28300 [Mycobacterium sp. CnD-18-1]|nr:hypothetical protein [Mycobacterium sp. CnD-18-1]